jgi:hypothetical protein
VSKDKSFTPNTRVMQCACTRLFPDERYGANVRVHNATRKPRPGWRCTVCRKEKEDML